jgi:hypothetical protein
MRLKIDSFYHDNKIGPLKYKGIVEGNLIFDNYLFAYGKWNCERVTFHPVYNEPRIKRLKPCLPPK